MIKFLIIQYRSLGEILLSTPLVRGLQEQVEGAEVHYLSKECFAETLINNPHIKKVHALKDNLDEVIDEVLVEDFDYIIDLQLDSNTHQIKQKIPVVSFEYDALNFKQWLYVNFKINRLPGIHLVDRYLQTAQVFDVNNDGKGLDFFIPAEDEVNAVDMHAVFEGKFMAVLLDSEFGTRNIPIEKLATIINMSGVPVCLLGSDNSPYKTYDLEQKLKVPFLNTLGKITLNATASLIKQSAVVLSSDSSYMHLATALNKPILSLWGNTVQDFGRVPYDAHEQSTIFEVKHLRCRPCTKRGFVACPKKHFKCMNDMDNAGIINKITSLLN